MISMLLICVVMGGFVGFLAGLLGIGGGLVIVPVLSSLLLAYSIVPESHSFLVAVATSMASIIVTSLSSARTHRANNNVPWNIVYWVVAGVTLGAGLSSFGADLLAPRTLKLIFTATLLFVAYRMLFSNVVEAEQERDSLPGPLVSVLSACIGGVASLIGIGGGALIVPLLTALRCNIKRAIGCSAVAGFFISVSGTFGYVVSGWDSYRLEDGFLGYVYLPALIAIVAATAITAPMGANATSTMPVKRLKRVFAIFLLLIVGKMGWSLFVS